MERPIRCYLEILSPLHLGCDEVYEPLSFVLDEKTQRLIVFEPWEFYARMSPSDRQRFSAICREGTVVSLLKIYQFLRGRPATGREVKVCDGLMKHYQDTLALSPWDERKVQQELNKFSIARTAFRAHDQRPYIPGSAIKGAWRTAYLNGLAQQVSMAAPRGGTARQLEEGLLGGSFDTDPFRLFKVSDFMPVGEVKTRIVYAVNEKKKPSKFQAQGPYQILEVIEPGAVFVGEMAVLERPPGAQIRKPLRTADLWAAAAFYRREKTREDEDLTGIDLHFPDTPPVARGALLRMGRHSGAECVTIEGHRQIKIMQGKGQPPKYEKEATTLWLASDFPKPQPAQRLDLKPFGWVVAGEVTGEQENRFKDLEAAWLRRQHSVISAAPAVATGKQVAAQAAPAPVVPPVQEAVAPLTPPAASGPSARLQELLSRLKATKPHDAGRVGMFLDGIKVLEEAER